MSNYLKAYKYRIYPNLEQREYLVKTFGCTRFIYNQMLADRIKSYQENKDLDIKAIKYPTPAQYKKEYEWLKEVDSLALANAQMNLDKAYKNFFRDKSVGFPKFKSKKTNRFSYTTNNQNGTIYIDNGYIKIPNKELMQEFEKALEDKSFGYVSKIIENSKNMLKATVNGDTDTIKSILHDIHNSEIPILQYNDENSLSCVLTLAYLAARDTYRIEKEEKSGKGYADFTFHPRRKNDTAFIVELKKDESPEVAINQIKKKEYVEKFKRENNNHSILAVAICYDSKIKEHYCKIEELR